MRIFEVNGTKFIQIDDFNVMLYDEYVKMKLKSFNEGNRYEFRDHQSNWSFESAFRKYGGKK